MVLESTVDNELPQTLVISNEQSEYAESKIFGSMLLLTNNILDFQFT